MKYLPLVVLMSLLGTGLGGCAAGPHFTGASTPPTDRALVYIFRKRTAVGSAGMFNVYANNKLIVKIKSGGYFIYTAEPGDLVLSHETAFGPLMIVQAGIDRAVDTKGKSLAQLHIEANHVYYVEWKLGGLFKGPTMIQSDESVALPIIRNCSLLQPAQ